MADRFKKQRQPIRGKFTRVANELRTLLLEDPVNQGSVDEKFAKLSETYERLKAVDAQVLDAILDDATDEEYKVESEAHEVYEDIWLEIRRKVDSLRGLTKLDIPVGSAAGSPERAMSSVSSSGMKKTYKLPKIEIKKFSGDIKDWLSFWSQFKKIHEDEDLHASDKFLYLLQSMVEGSEADTLLRMHQVTEAEYPNAVEALKQRFGEEEVLIDFYVRELINLTILNSQEKVPVSRVYSQVGAQLQCLESIGVKTEEGEKFLCPLILSCLPVDIVTAWHRSMRVTRGLDEDQPKGRLKKLLEFIRQEVEDERKRTLAEEAVSAKSRMDPKKKHNPKKNKKMDEDSDFPTAAGLFVGQGKSCIFCEKGHLSELCGAAQDMTIDDKKNCIKKSRACFGCLKPGHSSRDCRGFVKCVICSLKHHTIMCPEAPCNRNRHRQEEAQNQESNVNFNSCSRVLLKTLMVKAHDGKGSSQVLRILLDDGSEGSYITENAAKKLRLKPRGEVYFKKTVFGNKTSEMQRHPIYSLFLQDVKGGKDQPIDVVGESSLCGNLSTGARGPWMEEIRRKMIVLSDVEGDPQEIEVLVGSDFWGLIVTGKRVALKCGLFAYETTLGWALSGPIKDVNSTGSLAMSVIHSYFDANRVADFWNLESLGIHDPIEALPKSEKDQLVMNHFTQTVKQKEDGRYVVSLPWITEKDDIPSNRAVAEKRLASTTTKLKSLGRINLYDEVFRSWEKEGIITTVSGEDQGSQHFLPHRPVFKESETTPVRPVFDASCRMGRQPSLNQCLEPGPNLLELIPDVLMKFREKRIGVTSDIRKAFQMIEVQEEDQRFQRFLWWEDGSCKKMKIFQHQRVVFGINVSPFILHAVLKFHLSKVEGEDQVLARQFLESLYVDNSLTSVDSIQEYEDFKMKMTEILSQAKMELRQWEKTEDTPGIGSSTDDGCGLGVVGNRSHLTSVLGLIWNRHDDTVGVEVPDVVLDLKITKRKVLSIVQQVFDPLGFTCPATLQPKLILQELWKSKSGWDEEISCEVLKQFKKWMDELGCLSQVWIPRQVKLYKEDDRIQLHVFVDASQYAYATVIFLRNWKSGDEEATVRFLQAKSRVAPLKKSTIPRLELMACLIGARLASSCRKALDLQNSKTFFWSDSTTTLAWIKRNDVWGTFVGNRVREILQLSEANHWSHVPGEFNPADLPSRGCSPSQLLSSRWWEGPNWLKRPQEEWPGTDQEEDEDSIKMELKKRRQILISSKDPEFFTPPFSSYRKNVAIFSWIRRFLSNIRKKKEDRKLDCSLSLIELRNGELDLLRIVQDCFLSRSDKIPFSVVEKDGLLCVKSQLLNREDFEFFKTPILLPKDHPVVHLLISEAHRTFGHIGAQALLGKLREKYWILQGRKQIKNVIRQCTKCRRYESKPLDADPGVPPMKRVTLSSAFQTTGIDLAGPLYLKDGGKRWIVLYICAVYRCIQMDLVSSLSAEDFLDSLQRFVFTWGRPTTIFSDNGTNFHGTETLYKQINWDQVKKICEVKRIQWIFNPPAAPWWGGFWERLIRSVKGLLRRMLGRAKLTEDNLRTCLAVVTSEINDRPLTTVTEDNEDLIPLTPAMFLRSPVVREFPEAAEMKPEDFQNDLKRTTKLQEQLKQRFRSEYLGMLVNRAKEKKTQTPKVGDIVLVGAENKKRLDWPLGRIVELCPGKDGKIRVAKVKTKSKILIRPLQRLYPLEVSHEEVRDLEVVESIIEDSPVPPTSVNEEGKEANVKKTRYGRIIKPTIRL